MKLEQPEQVTPKEVNDLAKQIGREPTPSEIENYLQSGELPMVTRATEELADTQNTLLQKQLAKQAKAEREPKSRTTRGLKAVLGSLA